MLDLTTDYGRNAQRRLNEDPIAWLATVRPNGRPDLVPVWFLWEGDSILIYSQPNKPKLRNVASNPHVALALDDTRGGGDVVRIEGIAEIPDGQPSADQVPAYVEKYGPLIARIGYDPAAFAAAYSVALRVTPTRVGR